MIRHVSLFRDGKMGRTRWVDLHNSQFLVGWVDIFNPQKNFNLYNPSRFNSRAGQTFLIFIFFPPTQYTLYLGFFVDIYITLVNSIVFFFGTILLIIFMLYRLCCYLVDYEFYILL